MTAIQGEALWAVGSQGESQDTESVCPGDSVSSLTHGVWQGNPLQPRVRFGLRAEGQDVSGAIPRAGGSAFPGQSFVLYQVLYIHPPPAARAILDIHAGCSCTHVTSWAKLCYRGKSKVFVYPSQWKSLVLACLAKEGRSVPK